MSATPKSGWSGLSADQWAELGAYASPFSGTGVEFLPLGAKPEEVEIVLHEVGYLPHRPHWNYSKVFSPFWRFYYDLKAGHKVVFPDREVVLGPDRLVLIPDHQLFQTIGTGPRPKFWQAFSYACQLAPGQAIPVELTATTAEKRLIHDLICLLNEPRAQLDRHRVYHHSLALLHLALGRPEIAWQTARSLSMASVIRHIQENYARPLYIEDLARIAGMSETAFRRKFQTSRGVSPSRFIAQVRIREAAHLLATSTLDMGPIAERTGLPNAAYMSRIFKQITGASPAGFRRNSRLSQFVSPDTPLA
jgi:AraC-like DNA-binding protein